MTSTIVKIHKANLQVIYTLHLSLNFYFTLFIFKNILWIGEIHNSTS